MAMKPAPVIRGDIPPSKPADECVACGSWFNLRERRVTQGVLLMLCEDAQHCATTYRQGMTPAEYGKWINP